MYCIQYSAVINQISAALALNPITHASILVHTLLVCVHYIICAVIDASHRWFVRAYLLKYMGITCVQLSRCGRKLKEWAGQNTCLPLFSVGNLFCHAHSSSFRPQRLKLYISVAHTNTYIKWVLHSLETTPFAIAINHSIAMNHDSSENTFYFFYWFYDSLSILFHLAQPEIKCERKQYTLCHSNNTHTLLLPNYGFFSLFIFDLFCCFKFLIFGRLTQKSRKLQVFARVKLSPCKHLRIYALLPFFPYVFILKMKNEMKMAIELKFDEQSVCANEWEYDKARSNML